MREFRANSSASSEPRQPIGRQKNTHKNCDGDQNPNNFQKQTFTSRGTKLSLNGPILSDIEVSVGTNPKSPNFEHPNFGMSELRTPRTYPKKYRPNSNFKTSNFCIL